MSVLIRLTWQFCRVRLRWMLLTLVGARLLGVTVRNGGLVRGLGNLLFNWLAVSNMTLATIVTLTSVKNSAMLLLRYACI